MLHFFPILAFFLYLLTAVAYVYGVVRKSVPINRFAGRLHRFGFAFHTVSLIPFLFDRRLMLLENGGDYFFWFSWVLSLSYFLFGRKLEYPIIGALIAPAAALFMLSSSYLVHLESATRVQEMNAVFLGVHALPALIAEVSLIFAFIVSCVFLIQEKRLKRKGKGTLLVKGPGLESLELFNRRFVLVGFIAMTCAVVTGCVWAMGEGRSLLVGDLKQWTAFATWILLALILHSRFTLRWSATKVSKVTVIVSGLFLISLLVMVLFLGHGLHGGYAT